MKTARDLTTEIEIQYAIGKDKEATPYFKRKAKERINLLRGFLALYERGFSEEYVLNTIVKLDKQYAAMKEAFWENGDNWKKQVDKETGEEIKIPPKITTFEKETGAKKIKQQSANLKLLL